MGRQLDYRRGGRPVRRWRRGARWLAWGLAAAVLGFGAWLGGPYLAAWARGVPDRVLALAAPAFEAQLSALREENFALRTALAETVPLIEENDALRDFAHSPARPQGGRFAPARLVRAAPGTLVLACGAAVPAGAAVLDRRGRYVGRVTADDGGGGLTVTVGAAAACLAGASGGVLQTDGGWAVAGLARAAAPHAGTLVTTADGYWVGLLAADPTPDDTALTARAPLADTADLAGAVYFVAAG